MRPPRFVSRFLVHVALLSCAAWLLLLAGCGGGAVSGQTDPAMPTVALSASPAAISQGGSSVLSVAAANATQVTVTGTDGSSYSMPANGGTQNVTPSATTTYTAIATGASGKVTATATVTVTAASVPTVSINASPTSVAPGGSASLTVVATNAAQVVVTGSDGSSYTLSPTGGTQAVTPVATTTYTAAATGTGGKATATATVTVASSPASNIVISASPTSIAAGGSSVLSVTAMNAAQVKVTGSDGSSYTLSPAGGTQTVTPAATTTYTAVATGTGGGTSSATATITVAPAPTVAIVASPTSIAQGASSVLTVTAANATQVQIFGTDTPLLPYPYSLSPTGGTQTVTPAATTTYTAVATNASGGKVSASMTVTVGSGASVTIAATPASITAGGSSTLSITASNATQVTVTGSDRTSYTLPPTGGSQTVSPTATTTYTATATGNVGGNVTQTATVTVSPAPTVTFSASPASISPGGSATLSVTATNASQVMVTGSDGSSYTLPPTGGTQQVTPAATTTYTAIATALAGGKITSTATVTVGTGATITLSANPTSVASGASSTLSVTATNATQVTVTGSDGSSYTLPPAGGTQNVAPTATTTYTGIASAPGGNVSATATITVVPAPTITITADPSTIASGGSSVLTVTAANATQVTVTGSDSSSYTLQPTGGTQKVTPATSATYTATATGVGGNVTATAAVTVTAAGSSQSISHVVFMLQENRSFDSYFGLLNKYRAANGLNVGDDGNTYNVDGIDDKLTTISNANDEGTAFAPFKFTSTCVDDLTSAWLESYGDVSRYDFTPTRNIVMDGFVHTAEGFAKSCSASGTCSGNFTDLTGQRAMGYYDETFLNYYYYMASEFALSDRWFSPVSSKSIDNRIATFTGGTTQGLTHDPGSNDHLPQLAIPTIFSELTNANVSWKIYYTVTQGSCLSEDDCSANATAEYPATNFTALQDSYKYLYENPTGAACTPPTMSSQVAVNDPSNSFCIDPTHIAPLATYYTDLTNGTLPSFAFIEAGYGVNDEHPGSGQSILSGQAEVAKVVNAFMASPEWSSSVFFLSYDEGGGPYDHVPPVPGHSNDFTDATVDTQSGKATIPDIRGIAVNADSYNPCLPSPPGMATLHCDLGSSEPGANAKDAAAVQGFAAQLGFRLPNMVISPFTRKHYVSHIPMDHTAILKFVEDRFIPSPVYLTARDAAQPNLLDFFDFTAVPWATPPPNVPAPVTPSTLGYDPCTPTAFAP